MKLIIDISKSEYDKICLTMLHTSGGNPNFYLESKIANGIPIPDNATNERMVGSWIKSRDSYGNNHFTCPFCEHDIATRYAASWDDNYCSNCGAKMENVEKSLIDIKTET